MTNKPKSSKRKVIIITLIIAALAVAGFIFKRNISVKYYDLTHNHFKEGDKVYLATFLWSQKSGSTNFTLYRLIRPITKEDIEEMPIDKLEKATLINKIDPSLKPYLMEINKDIESDSLLKSKSAYLGTYLYHKVLYYKEHGTGRMFFDNAYAIVPDYRGYKINILNPNPSYLLPPNYTWADDAIYFPAPWISDSDNPNFKK